jgi:hypothetical protein
LNFSGFSGFYEVKIFFRSASPKKALEARPKARKYANSRKCPAKARKSFQELQMPTYKAIFPEIIYTYDEATSGSFSFFFVMLCPKRPPEGAVP